MLRALSRPLVLSFALLVPACASTGGDEDAHEVDTSETAASLATEAVYQEWAPVVRAAGAETNPGRLVTVLGVRGRSLDGARHAASSRKSYDDTFVVLLADGTGFVLSGSTHPFQSVGVSGVPDVDGDGAADVGRIRPGQYLAIGRGAQRPVAGLPGYDVVTHPAKNGRLPGVRDTNHDGTYDGHEDDASRNRGDGITAVLFHHGDEGSPAAVGCQVLPREALRTLVRAVGGASATFHYVLVDSPEDS
jgi:hypothetical protein